MPAIDFGTTIQRARMGMYRASIFMGLGINAARRDDFVDYDLSHDTKINIVPRTTDPEVLSSYRKEFEHWIIANGLRELLEGFIDFTEKLHENCLTLGWSKDLFTAEQCTTMQSKFNRGGLKDKFSLLSKLFGISSEQSESVVTINQARNCYTHRRGRVGNEDITDGSCLLVHWYFNDIYIVRPGHKPILNRDIPDGGLPTPDGGHIEVRRSRHELRFAFGQFIELSPLNIAEFCFVIDEASGHLADGAFTYAKSIGIEARERPSE